MKKNFLTTALFGLLFSSSVNASVPSNIIVFGDSLSDVGNNTWIEATGTPFTNQDERANKYAWPSYLSKQICHKPALPSSAYFSRSRNNSVVYAYASSDTSADYLAADWPKAVPVPAVNAACTAPGLLRDGQGYVKSTCVPGVLKQIDLYLSKKHAPNPNSVFIIWAGANDLFYKLPSGIPPQKIIETAVTNLLQAKNKLLENGVTPQQIYVLNLPDLSLTPYAIKYGLKLTELTNGFNAYLLQALTNNADPKNPGLPSNHVISMFDLLNDVVKSPEKYDLTNTQDSCVDKSETPLCQGYVFYNMKHPTAAMHKIIANYIGKQIS